MADLVHRGSLVKVESLEGAVQMDIGRMEELEHGVGPRSGYTRRHDPVKYRTHMALMHKEDVYA
jgi:hypothetical protein